MITTGLYLSSSLILYWIPNLTFTTIDGHPTLIGAPMIRQRISNSQKSEVICHHMLRKRKPVRGQTIFVPLVNLRRHFFKGLPCMAYRRNSLTSVFNANCFLLIANSSLMLCNRARSGVGGVDSYDVFLPPPLDFGIGELALCRKVAEGLIRDVPI